MIEKQIPFLKVTPFMGTLLEIVCFAGMVFTINAISDNIIKEHLKEEKF